MVRLTVGTVVATVAGIAVFDGSTDGIVDVAVARIGVAEGATIGVEVGGAKVVVAVAGIGVGEGDIVELGGGGGVFWEIETSYRLVTCPNVPFTIA